MLKPESIFWGGNMAPDRSYLLLLAVLLISGCALVFSLIQPAPKMSAPLPFPYAHGYYASFPRIGRARVVPVAPSVLQSPASTAPEAGPDSSLSIQNSTTY